jgi:hypothetical protein
VPGEPLSGPLRRTLDEVLDALASAGARAAIAGGIAQQVWGRIRATRDLDLLVLSVAGERPVLDALKARGLRATRKPRSIAAMTLHSFVRDDPEGFIDVQVDLFFVTTGLGPEAVERAVSLPVAGRAIPVVRAEDLLLLKLLADRVLDRADAQDIVREQGARLDVAYLRSRAATLGLAAALERTLQAARA